MKKSPVVLCLLEGFGLSSSWRGNAIASANPQNFYDLWSNYEHKLLFPTRSASEPVFDNSELFLSSLFSGHLERSNHEMLATSIESGQIDNSPALLKSFEQVKKSNSSLHLIGNLSGGSGEYGDLRHLISLLKIAKQKNIYRVYIHLITDSSSGANFEQISSLIHWLNNQLELIGVGEIATISGMKYLENWDDSKLGFINFSKAQKAIVEGRGNVYLSAEQALSQNSTKISSNNSLPPCTITYKNHPVGAMHDLDSVIFFNHNNSKITNFISSLCPNSSKSGSLYTPKFLNVSVFFDDFIFNQEVNVLIPRNRDDNLIDNLSKQKLRIAAVSDSFRSSAIKSIFGKNNYIESFTPALSTSKYCANPKPSLLDMFKHTAFFVNEKVDFIFLDIPTIDIIANEGSFDQAVKSVKIIDEYLIALSKRILDANGVLLITSDYGNAEKMVHRNSYELLNRKTQNPLPFVFVSNESQNSQQGKSIENELMYGIIQRKNNITDIAPTILELFELPASYLPGKSLV